MDLDAVAHTPRPARLGFDVGVLDESCLERIFRHGRAAGEGRGGIAVADAAVKQQVAGLVRLHQRRIRPGGGVDAEQRRLRRPDDRHFVVADREHRLPLADQRHHGLAAIAHQPVGQHRLILHVGIDAVAVERNILCRQHRSQAPAQRAEVAQGEARPRMRRAHDPDPQRVGRNGVGTEQVAAGDLGMTIESRQAGANGSPRRRCHESGRVGGGHHGIDDLGVARAAAQHAAQRLFDLGAARPRRGGEEIARRHQHAGRADAALGRAMGEEGFLEIVEVAVGESLDRFDGAALDLTHGHETAADLPAVELHGACATVAGVAANLGAGQSEIVTQRAGQSRDRRAVPGGRSPVQGERHLHAAKPCSRRRSRVRATSLR